MSSGFIPPYPHDNNSETSFNPDYHFKELEFDDIDDDDFSKISSQHATNIMLKAIFHQVKSNSKMYREGMQHV